MCVIIAAHASSNLRPDASRWCTLVLAVFFAAGTPGFSLVSGTLFGYFVASRPSPSSVARKYQQRALALVVCAHPIIATALYGPIGGEISFLKFLLGRWYITDTLALIFLATPILARFRPWHCLVAGVALPLVGRVILVTAPTDNVVICLTVNVLAGVDRMRPSVLIDCYGLLPILAYFLLGMFVGHRFARSARSGQLELYVNRVFRYAIPIGACSLALVGIYAAVALFASDPARSTLKWFFYPTRDFSMLPGYVAVFIVMFAMLLRRYDQMGQFSLAARSLALIGQRSLFVYCTQYMAVQTLPHLVQWQGSMSVWQLLLFITIAYLFLLCLAWFWSTSPTFFQREQQVRETHEKAIRVAEEDGGYPHRDAELQPFAPVTPE